MDRKITFISIQLNIQVFEVKVLYISICTHVLFKKPCLTKLKILEIKFIQLWIHIKPILRITIFDNLIVAQLV